MSEWQPIETAPKDLTEVLVYCPQTGVTVAQFENRAVKPYWNLDTLDLSRERNECWPTHWMHLPTPPRDAANGGGK
jgi:hypothetical protein